MQFITPQIFHVAATTLDDYGVSRFLAKMGVPEWTTNAPSDQEKLIELGGKLCYLSFKPQLNLNVSRVTEDNKKYIGNILNQKHGSVIEHGVDSFILFNVSRILTHELVRHRVGTAFSQVSGRYVRTEDISMWFPEIFETHEQHGLIKETFSEVLFQIENGIAKLTDILALDKLTNFNIKKKLTSALRRLAPNGMANHILVTANHRAWRHMIESRTTRHAEEEIRDVFGKIYFDLLSRYPNIYQDSNAEMVEGFYEIIFINSKI
jgi:thymidylate synthase (FAD)